MNLPRFNGHFSSEVKTSQEEYPYEEKELPNYLHGIFLLYSQKIKYSVIDPIYSLIPEQ